jgi:peptidyl-prolyl cis-trans isomerase D
MIRFLQSGNKAAKYILSGFLLIICGGMVVYLIPGFLGNTDASGRSDVLATVAGETIHADQATKLVQAQMRQQRVPDFYMPILMQQVVQRLIQTQEVRYEAGRMGLKVSNQEVQDELQHGVYKQYFFPDGKWIGQQQYEKFLTDNGLTVDGFESDVKDSLLANKLFNTVAAGVQASPTEVAEAYKQQNTKVKFQYAALNLADIQKEVQPSETELKAFYETYKQRYENSIPEKRQIRYFVLNDKDIAAQVTVDASDLQRYYNANPAQFRTQERARARHILIKMPPPGPDGKPDQKAVDEARAKAADILKQIKAGGDFAELAKKYSQDSSAAQGGELGWAIRGGGPGTGWVPEFEKVAFSQAPGQISDVVQSPFGFHIIQTEEKEAARVRPLSEVKDEITPLVRAEKASALMSTTLNNAQATAKKQGLDKAAAQSGAQVVQSNPVSKGDVLPGIGPAPELMNLVFASSEKDAPQAGRFAQGYMIFEVAKVIPPSTPSFEAIKDKVTADFKNQQAGELLRKKTQELSDRAHSLHDLAKAAKESGATLKTSDLVTRTSQVPELGGMGGPPLNAAFAMKPGEISGPLSLGMKGAVLQLLDRQEPSLTDPQFAQARDGLQEQLSQQKRQEALELFMNNLDKRMEKEGKIKRNNAEINNLTRSRS